MAAQCVYKNISRTSQPSTSILPYRSTVAVMPPYCRGDFKHQQHSKEQQARTKIYKHPADIIVPGLERICRSVGGCLYSSKKVIRGTAATTEANVSLRGPRRKEISAPAILRVDSGLARFLIFGESWSIAGATNNPRLSVSLTS